ncbi:hypothetical protein HPP92_023819 [Vanilla planifolia]|uniref:Chaperone DnaJ C-terminal domain-containing protein n=1 Tax=Vanilla planifolia TaxID=51239 RepID=A0A835U9P5_VANPL|nr:hypothetical protein HPP92_024191 [Vanilla planifolia]KAG0456031.1 hypothetical protein HPP92_023819 [Vanilla planifolia]
MPHEMFTREGNDLITTQKISLAQAVKGYTAHLKTLDGRTLTIPISSISSIIHPRYEEVVHGEGMPIAEDPSKRGNLKIRGTIAGEERKWKRAVAWDAVASGPSDAAGPWQAETSAAGPFLLPAALSWTRECWTYSNRLSKRGSFQ